ncbi:MAG: hypothetical protein ACT4N5_02430 [Nitrosopumilaceae archaeon]
MKPLVFIVMIFAVCFSLVLENAHAEQYSIPTWIKNNAKWWSDGQIEDADFVKGIQYLIKSEVIIIPLTGSSDSQSSQKIPAWIKNNAGWWADGKISDNDFVLGFQYLISNGIIRINPDAISDQEPTKKLSVKLEGKTVVNLGEAQFVTVTVTEGKDIVTDASVTARVTYSYGNIVKNFEGVSNYYGEFRFSWKIEGYTPGTYTVKIDATKSGYTSANGLFSFKVLDL